MRVANVKPKAVKQVASSRLIKGPQPVAWPKPAAADVDLATATATRGASASAAAARVRVGSLPVKVGRVGTGPKAGAAAAKAPAPGLVRVQTHDRATAKRLGVSGLVMSLNRADGQRGPAPMSVELDYSSFAHAYGGDWASRLRLVQLPACALDAAKAKSCGRGTPLRTVNDAAEQTLVADVSTASAGLTVLAAEATPSGDNGDYTATSLSAAGTWQVSNQSGDFSWSLPLRMPPALNGPAPSVSFGYSSGSVDGRTGSSNNQGSWIGDGWDSWPGFIERKYASCSDDNPSRKTGDQCWFNDNATLSLNGHAGELVQSGSIWRLKDDDGTKVERVKDGTRDNGDNDDEYWKVTTPDGIQYYFGYHKLPGWAAGDPVTDSTWTAPVFGNNDAEPCHNDDFDKAYCDQAWRWNLDYVIDPHNNTLAYYYGTEQGAYARNSDIDKRTTYDRGGYLRRAEYGMRRGAEYAQAAPLRVMFNTAERCLADCWSGAAWTSAANPAAWADTPWEQFCAAAPCREQGSPTFWSARRLTKVTTQQRTGATSYGDIESWRLRQEFISAGNGEGIPMWLRGVTRTGHVGGTVTDPEITFNPGAEPLDNRVDGPADQRTALKRWRIKELDTESGGKILITYSDKECTRATLPTAHSNTKRCMPAYYSWPGTGDPTIDWFHKYVVTRVDLDDVVSDQPNETTFYDYLDSPAWHYLDDEITKDKYKTWGDWRGYSRVRVRHGDATGKQTAVEYRYLRGMDGDKQPNNTRRDVSVTDWGGTLVDHEALRGFVRQETTLNGATATTVGGEVASTVNDQWKHGPTATRTRNGLTTNAWKVKVGETRTRTALAAGGFRTAKTATDFNADGLPIAEDDFGDAAVTGDETCTRTSYARNDTTWMIDKVSQVETLSRTCDGAPATAVPSTVLSRTRTFYDQYVNEASFGDAPTKGNVVRTEDLNGFNGTTPVYVRTTSNVYDDPNGRVTSVTDARGFATTTAYTTANGGLVTGTVGKNPFGHAVTTVKDPAWDLPTKTIDPNGAVTELDYDAQGKLTAVWLPGRARTTTPNTRFSYLLRKTGGPAAVTTETLLNSGAAYKKSINLYDGFLRQRQTQAQATGGGRLLIDTFHNTLGQVEWESQAYYDSTNTAPGTDLGVPQGQIPGITETVYDGAGRETAKVFKALGVQKWRTTTSYDGNRQTIVPPRGGTATTALTDVRDRTTVLRQYKNPADAGSDDPAKFDATTYTYDLAGNLRKLLDPAGNAWAYTYDLRGNQTSAKDPDKGLTETTYDTAGNVATSKDANGSTLAYTYDALGRKTSLRDGTTTGTKRAEWIFDTLPNGIGKQTKSIRWVGAAAYESRVDAYNAAGQPTSTSIAIPSSEGTLCASETATPCVYTTAVTYKANGATATSTLPKAGDLAAEKLHYGHNDIGEQTSILSAAQIYVDEAIYDRVGQLTGRVLGAFGSRVAVTSTFDEPTRRLKSTNVVPELKPEAANYAYTYDDIGNITKINEASQGQTADTQCFTFDHLRRLDSAWTPASNNCAPAPATAALGGPAPYWHAWEYDKIGDRVKEHRHAAAGTTTFAYTHPTPGEAAVRPHAVTGVTMTAPGKSWTRGFTYDNAGNMATRMSDAGNQQTLKWDPEGRLDKVTEGGKDTTFIYDADGKRLIRKDTTKRVLYLPGGSEVSVAATATVAKATRYYTHKDTTIATRTAAGLHWIVGDHHGTAEVTIKASDLTVTKRRTLPFGEDRGTAPGTWPSTHDKGFVGGTKDPTGLTHLGARLYDPAIGRFISVDPVIDTKDPQQLNAYAYSNNNPVTLSDPGGEFWGALKKAGSAVASAASTAGNAVANTVGNVVESIKEDPLKFAVGLAVGIAAAAAVAAVCATGVGCLILAGVVAGAAAGGASYGVDVGQGEREFSAADLGTEMAIGGAIGGLTAGAGVAAGRAVSGARTAVSRTAKPGPGMADDAASAGRSADDAAGGACRWMSFTAATPVLLANGATKPIGKLQVGDRVTATDPISGITRTEPVVALFEHEDLELADVTIIAETGRTARINTTQNHPFWSATTGKWTPAAELKPGEQLRKPDGTAVTVTAVRTWVEPKPMYNIGVSDLHTYYVIASGIPVLVHNRDPDEHLAGKVTLWRAVTDAELKDIHQTRRFRSTQGIKYFSFSERGAAEYARRAYRQYPAEGPYTMIRAVVNRADIPASAVMPHTSDVVDGGVALGDDALSKLERPRIMPQMGCR